MIQGCFSTWDKYSLPPKVRHGAIITISRKQYDAVVERFGIDKTAKDKPAKK